MEKILSWTLDIILMLFSVLFLTLAIVSVKNYHFDTNIIREYKENWERAPMIDIVTTDSTCPDKYEPFISNTFPGNREGCDCLSSDKEGFKGKMFDRRCDQYNIAYGCKMIFPANDISLVSWRGAKLCVLRMDKNFWELTINKNISSKDEKCENKGLKSCGVIDTFKNILCIDKTYSCPINEIIILPVGSNPPADGNSYVKRDLNNNYNLFFSKNNNNYPVIVEIEARQHPVCTHPFEGELGENDYMLNTMIGSNVCKTSINGELNDHRFEDLDTQNTLNFFNENGVTKLITQLPNYPFPTNQDTTTLYKINYFGWNKNCFNDVNFSSSTLVSPQVNINNNSNQNYALAVIALIHFMFVMLSIVIYKMIIEKLSVNKKIVFILDVINIIFLVILFSLALATVVGTDKVLLPLRNFIEKKCGDDITNSVMEMAFSDIKNVNKYLIPILIFSALEIGYIIGYYIWLFFAKKYNYLQEEINMSN